MRKPSEIWKDIKPLMGEMVATANEIESRTARSVKEAYDKGYNDGYTDCREPCENCEERKKAVEEAYQRGLDDGMGRNKNVIRNLTEKKAEEFEKMYDDGHQCGIEEIWECLKKIANMSLAEKDELFGVYTILGILNKFTPVEVIESISTYEHKKKIRIGDIIQKKDNPSIKVFVTSTDGVEKWDGIALTTVDGYCSRGDHYDSCQYEGWDNISDDFLLYLNNGGTSIDEE